MTMPTPAPAQASAPEMPPGLPKWQRDLLASIERLRAQRRRGHILIEYDGIVCIIRETHQTAKIVVE